MSNALFCGSGFPSLCSQIPFSFAKLTNFWKPELGLPVTWTSEVSSGNFLANAIISFVFLAISWILSKATRLGFSLWQYFISCPISISAISSSRTISDWLVPTFSSPVFEFIKQRENLDLIEPFPCGLVPGKISRPIIFIWMSPKIIILNVHFHN